ncbi:GDP-mannose 4,6-dehydratase [Paenibacillus massiliensis]|uniref:GDP-mannose 4,6-dehydratase n=1 Tax=Paenibacillus massiliensis TaxID=225917 RepID=UPI0003662733|nr:GDP-mannose 4,6-dehydratase [Paenibacillus massiliensis]
MKRALITGINGFVGQYLAKELESNGYEVWGSSRSDSLNFQNNANLITLQYGNKQKIVEALEAIQPTVLFHLSALSSVAKSWNAIAETFETNLMATIELVEAVRSSSIANELKIVSVGSSEQYGLVDKQPITEDAALNPLNPYGLSKLTMEKTLFLYQKLYDMNIVHVRPFNHIGPGQRLGFVVTDFVKQITDIEKGLARPFIGVGDLTARRDFTDVRDIVKGYRLVSEVGIKGEAYNICSGVSVEIQSILDTLLSFASKQIEVYTDNEKIRPVNILEYYGDNSKLRNLTGWSPEIALEDSLKDIYDYWMNTEVSI